MKPNYKSIFAKQDEILSQEEIRDYVSGKMTEKEKHRIEVLLAANPLLADAVEGYQDYPKNIGGMKKNPFVGNTGNYFFIWSVMSLVLLAGLGVWYFNRDGAAFKVPSNPLKKNKLTEAKIIEHNDQEMEEIIESHYSDSSIQITSKITKNKEVVKEKYAQVEEKSIPIQKIEPKALVSKKISDSIRSNSKAQGIVAKKIFDTYHIVDYTVYDYRGKREEPIKILVPSPNGTPASQANKNSIKTDSNPITKVFYADYLKEAIIFYSKENYKQASKRFKTILKKYPQDVNALFYEALCSYHRNKPKQAIKEFHSYLNQPIGLFDEDAEYFLALSLLQNGNNTEAKDLLMKIANSKGFYHEQAKSALAKLM